LENLSQTSGSANRSRKARVAIARLLMFWLIWSFPTLCDAQPLPSVFLEELTWTELRAQIAAGKTTVIVPIGGTEQSGPAIALGKHSVRVKLLSERIAVALGNAVVAPVIAYVPEGNIDPPTGHMRFPGTITVPDATFEQVLESAARSFKLHGFKDIVFLGDHGGYQANERKVADKLNREWSASKVRAHAINEYYEVTQGEYVQALKNLGFTSFEIGTHAGLNDTSLMLALDARLVRTDRLSAEPKLGSADGVYGDPTRSTAKLGMAGVDAIVSRTVAAINAAVAHR
jgi:creatinine amidohydrolase